MGEIPALIFLQQQTMGKKGKLCVKTENKR
jgi:hypothetical protein